MTVRTQRGSSLVETLVALLLLLMSLVAAAPLFVFAMRDGVANADMGSVGAAAVQRMELLAGSSYGSLRDGGSLTADKKEKGRLYYDDSNPEVLTRWRISTTGVTNVRCIEVVALSKDLTTTPRKSVSLITLRTKE